MTVILCLSLNSGATATDEAKKIVRTVHKILSHQKDPELIEKVGDFS